MTSRYNYWTCSRFSEWCRSLVQAPPKLKVGSCAEWNEWRSQYKAQHPKMYWFTEEVLGKVQDFIYWPYDRLNDARCYLRNRFITKTHIARTTLKKGQWHETEERLLHSMFGLLVQYVESECAYHNSAMFDNDNPLYAAVPWHHKTKWFDVTELRSRELGIDYIGWECGLTYEDKDGNGVKTQQAIAAEEIRALYRWWVDVRPNRPEAQDASGLTAWYESKPELDPFSLDDLHGVYGQQRNDIYQRMDEIERQYETEDTEMMVRLIKIRQSLWT